MLFSRPRRQVSKLEEVQKELRTEPVPSRFPTYVSIVETEEQRDLRLLVGEQERGH
jgi:hypothetical protein